MNKEHINRLKTALRYISLRHPTYRIISSVQGALPVMYIIAGLVMWSLTLVLVGGVLVYVGHLLTNAVELPMIEKWMVENA